MPCFVPSAESTEVMTSILDEQKVNLIPGPDCLKDMKYNDKTLNMEN